MTKKTRIRVCGVLTENDKVLLLKHNGIGKEGYLWAPPGGGLDFGESMIEALKREFFEETGISVEVQDFLFLNEYIDDKFHAVELFFRVNYIEGHPKLGKDPEFKDDDQILSELKFISFEELNRLPNGKKHNIFSECKSEKELLNLKGFYNFINI